MAQFGRPISDASIGTWKDQGDGTTNIYTTIDETSASDADYIKSVDNPSSAPYATGLTTTLEDPVSNANHIIRWRRQKSASGGGQIDLTITLNEGYTNEGSPGTQRCTTSDTDIPAAWASTSYTLSSGEADAITDYTDLTLRIVANQST